MTQADKRPSGRKKRKRRTSYTCECCAAVLPFAWTCRCGFSICMECMKENAWGMTCNHITWCCPDCGKYNGFGNQ